MSTSQALRHIDQALDALERYGRAKPKKKKSAGKKTKKSTVPTKRSSAKKSKKGKKRKLSKAELKEVRSRAAKKAARTRKRKTQARSEAAKKGAKKRGKRSAGKKSKKGGKGKKQKRRTFAQRRIDAHRAWQRAAAAEEKERKRFEKIAERALRHAGRPTRRTRTKVPVRGDVVPYFPRRRRTTRTLRERFFGGKRHTRVSSHLRKVPGRHRRVRVRAHRRTY